jgi:two-component system chemotaxis response regulator CheB
MSIRVLVVDDTVVFRRAISEALAGLPGVEVVGAASNGKLALARIQALQPDLLTLDVEMPEMNGIELLESLRTAGLKTGAIMLSSLTRRGGEMTVRALELGAFDFLPKPETGTPAENVLLLRQQLAPMLRAFERRRDVRTSLGVAPPRVPLVEAAVEPLSEPTSKPLPRRLSRLGARVVLIGVSTGGPAALAAVLPSLPSDLGVPVLVVQHMPPMFTQPLAESLARKCAIRVKEAEEGELALPNCAYVAPGGKHLKVAAGGRGEILLRLTADPPENGCRPSVDYLFRSAALQLPGRTVAAILTGMGNDGTAGLKLLKRGGCISIAQDEASCVVFGMPKEAIAAGVVDTVVPLDQVAGAILRSLRGVRT